MMEIPIAVFAVLLIVSSAGIGVCFIVLALIQEGELVPRKRIHDHEATCFTYYWERIVQQNDRIRKLERELKRVPRSMRSRKTRKLVG